MSYKDKEKQRAYCREWMRSRRQEWLQENGPCVDCGSWEKLEVDHEDPSTKISHCVWSWRADRRALELSKCKVRCEECHKIKTGEYLSKLFTKDNHGTKSCYMGKGCRCDLCKEAYRIWRRAKYIRCGN